MAILLGVMELLEKVDATIEKHGLLESGDAVLIALSGGPDSVCLLRVLCGLQRKWRLRLSAVYINHQIRKSAAAGEERFCFRVCKKLGVPLIIMREDIRALAKREKKGLEEAARDFRYETFERLAKEQACTRIALGHHADDQVETILFRIFRGTGRTGLGGMPIRRGKIIRPLLELTRAQILDHLKRLRQGYCVDQSNRGIEFSRNYIRNRLLPEIKRRLNPRVERALLNLADTIGQEEEYLKAFTAKEFARNVRVTVGGKIQLDSAKLEKYDAWLRRRVLRFCVGMLSGAVTDKEVIDRLDASLMSGEKGLSLPNEIEATRTGDRLLLRRRQRIAYSEPLEANSDVRPGPLEMLIRCRVRPMRAERRNERARSMRVTVDWEKIAPPLLVRSIRAGDRFQPLGLTGRKKVNDYLADRKVPSVLRDEVPVVCDSRGIIWLVGFEIADRVKIDATTEKVASFEAVFKKQAGDTAV